ncbi:MAG: polysaccharide lyase 6 family protein [Abitibacteriaceae bacterium]|nr:polysaccharide lyase 6 family protein [Abditibacteriaceae bacterium]MBV9865431.1 polysaccharide lyase 6 family protein [Abditibacteriaceae bacterium]
MRLNLKLMLMLLCGAAPALAQAAEHQVSSAAAIARVMGHLKPGDVVVLADGTWQDQEIKFEANGTAAKPIVLRAQDPGKVVLTGRSSVTTDGTYLVVSGLCLKDGGSATDGIAIKGSHCRLTETALIGGTYKFFVHLYGSKNRVDHCYLAGKTSESPTLQVEVEGAPNYHRLDHNHFGPRPPLGRNGGETMRVGYSHQSMRNSRTLVEQNLFDQCDGEIEIISSKSCENIYRFNTFLDCAGMLTLRHGNRCRVESNFFLGHHKQGSGGIRVIGEDHIILNNYIEGVTQGAFWITAGIPNSPLNGYFQARGCSIAFNTVVDSRGPYLALDAGMGTSRRTLGPENITVANNVFAVPQDGTLLKGTEGAGFRWMGNLTNATVTPPHKGIRTVDLKLRQAKDGLWRPQPSSPTRRTAEGDFGAVKWDIDGQLRRGRRDVGCDQISSAPITNRPLTAADVGPVWFNRASNKHKP